MMLWILLLSGVLMLGVIAGLVVHAMKLSERRARRSLYRALGISDLAIDELMDRNRDVSVELEALRGSAAGSEEA